MTWGYRPEPRNEFDEDHIRRIASEESRNAIQSASILGSVVPRSIPHNATATARSRVYYSPTAAANYTISATSMTEVDATNLAGKIACSGAPVLLMASIRGVEAGAAAELALGFTFDGAAPAGQASGAWATESTSFLGASFFVQIPTPRPGTRRFALAAMRVTANGLIYCGGGNSIELIAMEV